VLGKEESKADKTKKEEAWERTLQHGRFTGIGRWPQDSIKMQSALVSKVRKLKL